MENVLTVVEKIPGKTSKAGEVVQKIADSLNGNPAKIDYLALGYETLASARSSLSQAAKNKSLPLRFVSRGSELFVQKIQEGTAWPT